MRSRDETAAASTSEHRRPGSHAHPRRADRTVGLRRLADRPVPEPAAFPAPVAAPEPVGAPTRLRGLLVGVDAAAGALGWLVAAGGSALVFGPGGGGWPALVLVLLTGVVSLLLMIASQGLYRSRVCAVRAVEIARLGRAAAASAAAGLLVALSLGTGFGFGAAVTALVLTWFLLTACRGLYIAWLRRARALGRFCRPVVVIGTGDEGSELSRLIDLHPELGLRVAGVVGSRHRLAGWTDDVVWLGEVDDAAEVVEEAGANGVIVAVSDLEVAELNRVTRVLLAEGIHVQLSSGLRGVDQRRLRSMPLAHEPLFYLEPSSLSRWQLRTKRVLDLAIGGLTLVLMAPVLLVCALAVKLGDGGPVLFRQTRVGRDGRTFELLKLRTMVPDAEERLVDLTFANEREDGPLFKLTRDPRRTKVGRVLERTSLDELPQVINVLRGDMSLVGPRPALPHEVAQFDEELRGRQRVSPGITGLWQVEGRDNPAFDVYRRLDLFYVENWSVGFDLSILMATLQSVLLRLVFRSPKSEPVVASEVAPATTSLA